MKSHARPIPAPLSHDQLLAAVPVRNAAVEIERGRTALLLRVPMRHRWWMRSPWSLFFPMRKSRGFELDALGEDVWQACNGVDGLEHIIEQFARRHQVRFHEARLSVTQFLQTLIERKLVVLQLESAIGGERSELAMVKVPTFKGSVP